MRGASPPNTAGRMCGSSTSDKPIDDLAHGAGWLTCVAADKGAIDCARARALLWNPLQLNSGVSPRTTNQLVVAGDDSVRDRCCDGKEAGLVRRPSARPGAPEPRSPKKSFGFPPRDRSRGSRWVERRSALVHVRDEPNQPVLNTHPGFLYWPLTALGLTCVAADGRSKRCGCCLSRSPHHRSQRAYLTDRPQLNYGVRWLHRSRHG